MIINKRLIVSVITGGILGLVCIVGANLRYQNTLETAYLISFWFNRLLMGLIIGLISFKGPLYQRLLVGVFIGLFVSFAFYSATDFLDLMGFLVGGVYGIILVLVNEKVSQSDIKK